MPDPAENLVHNPQAVADMKNLRSENGTDDLVKNLDKVKASAGTFEPDENRTKSEQIHEKMKARL